MLEFIDLKFTETGPLRLKVEGTTLFVGPNNSGKSLLLKEIEQAFNVHPFPSGLRILTDYEIVWPTLEKVQLDLNALEATKPPGLPHGQVVLGRINPNGGREEAQLQSGMLLNHLKSRHDKQWIATQYLRWGVIRLDGRSRFNLTNDQPAGDLLARPQNVLAHLFKNDDNRSKVRSLIKEAFGLNFVIDPTNLGSLRIRLSTATPPVDEQSLNAEARSFHEEALYIKDASDGVQAFTGILTAICSGEFDTILIDEPEAFLHPPLARKLGRNLSALAAERGGALMASTHSSDFLMGCIQASSSVQVVRLEYQNGKSSARLIDTQALDTLFKSPLMRSANVISALFYDGAIIVESDNDRVFYNEIYHRLAAAEEGLPSILFINAQNKQTIKDIMGPLRKFGVAAAAITDIDVLKEGGKTWTGWLSAAQMSKEMHAGYGQLRSAVKDAFSESGKDMKTDGGILALSESSRRAGAQLLDELDGYGVFVVRRGELEGWLPGLKVAGKKTDWAIAMLERLGSDPSLNAYVKPGADDVWAFIKSIVAWVQNPARKGMP